jgi:RND family efflux transporter MFP subunit
VKTRSTLAALARASLAPGVLALAALGAAACGRHEAPAAPEPEPVRARVAVAERVTAGHRADFAGTVEAERSAAVSTRVMATVTAVHVELGDTVRAGQPLVSIDPTAAEGQVAQARGALAQADAARTLARRNLERYEALAASNAASQLELDLARTQLEQAEGAVGQSRGAVAAAQSVASESRVVAPFAGRVAARLVEVGDLAAPGRPLVRIESGTGRRLVVPVPETIAQAAGLEPGDPLPVTLDARPALGELAGRVAEVSPGPDPVTHAYTVKVDLPAVAGSGVEVAAGAAGRAHLAVGSRAAVRVPRAALVESGGLTLVVVRDAQGRAQSRVVTVGESAADGRVEILSGLAGGETVGLGLAVAPAAGARFEVLP